MTRIELEIDDESGDIVGDVPTAIDTIFKRIEGEAKKVAFGQGVEQAAKDAQKQIDETVRNELARRDAMAPFEKQRLEKLEADNKSLSTELAEATKESNRQRKALEESHAQDIIDRTKRLEAREQRIRQLTRTSIRGYALQAGAREESLDELELILEHYIGYGEDMEPFVLGPDGTPMAAQGKAVTLPSFVKDYLDKHPHHRRPATGRGGRALHGATLSGTHVPTEEADQIRARIDAGDRSASTIDALFKATRNSPVQ